MILPRDRVPDVRRVSVVLAWVAAIAAAAALLVVVGGYLAAALT
jgi:hypothetical protein